MNKVIRHALLLGLVLASPALAAVPQAYTTTAQTQVLSYTSQESITYRDITTITTRWWENYYCTTKIETVYPDGGRVITYDHETFSAQQVNRSYSYAVYVGSATMAVSGWSNYTMKSWHFFQTSKQAMRIESGIIVGSGNQYYIGPYGPEINFFTIPAFTGRTWTGRSQAELQSYTVLI